MVQKLRLQIPFHEDLYLALGLWPERISSPVSVPSFVRAATSVRVPEEAMVEDAVAKGALTNPMLLQKIWGKLRSAAMPESLLSAVTETFSDRYYGLEALHWLPSWSLLSMPARASGDPAATRSEGR